MKVIYALIFLVSVPIRTSLSGSTNSLLTHWWCRNPDNCAYCFDDYQCTVRTADPSLQVMKNVSVNAALIHLQYFGNKTNITAEHFKDFSALNTLILTGVKKSILVIEENAFYLLSSLTRFLLSNTQVDQLPENLFHPNNTIKKFEIPSNQFKILPRLTILKLKHLEYLDISSNPLSFCQNHSSFAGFEELSNFTNLTFSDIQNDSCPYDPQPSIDIFNPIYNRLTFLNYSRSGFMLKDVRVFRNFSELLTLDVSAIEKFSKCPAEFLRHMECLPTTVTTLYMRKWRSNTAFDNNCSWNTPDVRKNLSIIIPRLSLDHVEFKYSDMIFGNYLQEPMVRPFQNVSYFGIGYCRINHFDRYLFDTFHNLSILSLDGNPLGPRRLELFSNHTQAISVSMKRASIPTDVDFTYRFSSMFAGFFELKRLDLARNWLNQMPLLYFQSISIKNRSLILEEVNFDDNRMRDFLSRVRDLPAENSTLRKVFPNLKALYARRNYLRDLRHIPLNIEVLYLSDNQLGELHNEELTYDTLKQLTKLRVLNVDGNHFHSPPHDLLYYMPNLEEIYLYNNNLTMIPDDFFKHNPKLRRVNLGGNWLNSFDIVKAGISKNLEWIDLTDNSFSILPRETLDAFDANFPNLTYVTLGGNSFDCSCENEYFQEWAQRVHQEDKDIFMFVNRYKCAGPKSVEGSFFIEYDNSFECNTKPALILFFSVLGCFLIAALLSIFVYKYRWYFRHLPTIFKSFGKQLLGIKFYNECEYDAYISYNASDDEDTIWVKDILLNALEKSSKHSEDWKLFIWDRNAEAGRSKFVERCDKMAICRKLIIVLSESYMTSIDCLSEADLIGDSMNGTEKYEPNRVLVIIKEQLHQIPVDTVLKTLLTKNALLWKDNNSETRKENFWLKVGRFLDKGSNYRVNETSL